MSYEDWKRASWQQWELDETEESIAQPIRSPGKRTLTMSLPPRSVSAQASAQIPVQQKATPTIALQRKEQAALTEQWMDVALRPDLHDAPVQMYDNSGTRKPTNNLHDLASEGISGTATELPHLDKIQHSFGHHDVSGIKAHVNGPAAVASRAMGAQAYATGHHVAFREAPDLHTAAHEAAHVVQQRAGVQLKNGVGQIGDPYENHADAVADAVVDGQSAQGLLDKATGDATASPALSPGVQHSAIVQQIGGEPRIVQGAGGYTYKQYSDGTIEILAAPRNRGVGARLLPNNTYNRAITREIGAYPTNEDEANTTGSGPASQPEESQIPGRQEAQAVAPAPRQETQAVAPAPRQEQIPELGQEPAASGETQEEARLSSAETSIPDVVAVFNEKVEDFKAAMNNVEDFSDAQTIVGEHGVGLWEAAVERVQGSEDDTDDRPLYWARLQMSRFVRTFEPGFGELSDDQRDQLLIILENSSRGQTTANFEVNDGTKRVLISGFDPFDLDDEIEQTNPSGAAVLELDGKTLSSGDITAQVQAVVFPVRFSDFNEGVVESFFGPYLENGTVDMIVTISMGRPDQFDIERFPGLRRSSSSPDNLNELGGGSRQQPSVPPSILPSGNGQGENPPEFLEMSLPVDAMTSVAGTYPVHDNHRVATLEDSDYITPETLNDLAGKTSVEGSGGNYLSNEISYRTLLLRNRCGSQIPVGHLHTPAIDGDNAAIRALIVNQIIQILTAALPEL